VNETLLVFALKDFSLAFVISTIREIREPLDADPDILEALGLEGSAKVEHARSIVLEESGAVLYVSARPEILEAAPGSVVEVPALVGAHPSVTGFVLHEERVLVLVDAERIAAGAQ
jgi:chemotaxis signal transduction protein